LRPTLVLFAITITLVSFIGPVSARGGEFFIEPLREVTESVELTESDEVIGNVSVSNGFIDFYVTSPSGVVLLCWNQTAFDTFSFVAKEDGLFIIHLANTHQAENVEVTLNYNIHFKIVLQQNISVGFSLGTASVVGSMIPPTTPMIDWISFLEALSAMTGLASLAEAIRRFLRWLQWRRKYGKPRTPVVVSPH